MIAKYSTTVFNYIRNKPILGQIFSFLIVGGFCYVLSIILLFVFVEYLGIEVNLSNLLTSLFIIYVAYVLNGKFIFQKGKYSQGKEMGAFFLFSFFGLLLNISLMYLMVSFLLIHYILAKTIVTIMVAAFNFITRKYLIFNG